MGLKQLLFGDDENEEEQRQVVTVDTPAPTNTAELSNIYKWYVIYECILVNIVGFFTLFF